MTPCPSTHCLISPCGPIRSPICLLPSTLPWDFKKSSTVYAPRQPPQNTKWPAFRLMIRDIICAVQIEPDQCPPGMPKWVALSPLTVQDLEALLKMAPVLTRLNER